MLDMARELEFGGCLFVVWKMSRVCEDSIFLLNHLLVPKFAWTQNFFGLNTFLKIVYNVNCWLFHFQLWSANRLGLIILHLIHCSLLNHWKDSYLPLQSNVSIEEPEHEAPPFLGDGLLQRLVLFILSSLASHELHDPQELHAPFTM